MRHDGDRADAPQRWLENAQSDLAMARRPLPPGVLYEHVCFHAEQAVEKSIKAVLLRYGREFPFTHDLQALVGLLPDDLQRPPELSEAGDLSPYAVVTRYPNEAEPVTEEDYERALWIAEAVVEWAESAI